MLGTKVAIVGSGNIGTDVMIKISRLSQSLEVAALVGIGEKSVGLARAKRLGELNHRPSAGRWHGHQTGTEIPPPSWLRAPWRTDPENRCNGIIAQC